jgi:leucyl aminopeptidase
MQIKTETNPLESLVVDALVFLVFENAGEGGEPEIARQSGWLAELRSSGEFTGKPHEVAILHKPQGAAAKRLVLIGGGKSEKFSPTEARKFAGTAVRFLKPKGVRTIAFAAKDEPALVQALVEGALIGEWEPDKYKTDPKKREKHIEQFTVAAPGADADSLEAAADRGRIIAEAQNLARDLVNEPANQLTPAKLADAARAVAAETGLELTLLDEAAMRGLGMGALLGVAQGSTNPPFFIALKYAAPAGSGSDHLGLVGKGVTFDTGGISIKPSDGMEKMKYDMAGAAAVIAAMKAIALLKPPVSVTGYVPTVENMINGDAQRPGDIVKSLAGKTIEVLNTDAEGRLILADALTYANRDGVTHLIDAATLTGAIGIALGHHNMGVFTNDQKLANQFLTAARSVGEKGWQLPMDEEYKDYLKSAFADLPNIGGRYGGSITAAWFLREFADPTPWVHLDIAATAWLDDGKSWISKGPSGVAVRSFVRLALDWSN